MLGMAFKLKLGAAFAFLLRKNNARGRRPRLVATRGLAVTALFELQEDFVRFGNGVERRLERIEQRSRASVMVIPLLEDRVMLVCEYCAGSRQYELACPTGTPLPGETIK